MAGIKDSCTGPKEGGMEIFAGEFAGIEFSGIAPAAWFTKRQTRSQVLIIFKQNLEFFVLKGMVLKKNGILNLLYLVSI